MGEQKYAEVPSSIKEWSIVKFGKNSVQFQLTIENPLYISTTKDYDNVTLKFINAKYFKSSEIQYI